MEKIPFIKMAAAGNDFIIIDNRSGNIQIYREIIQKISDRKSWGCDQFIVLENSQKADTFMRIFNADGSEAGACGNATRCVAGLTIKEKGKKQITIETISAVLLCWRDGDMIAVNMGQPSFDWQKIFINSTNMNDISINSLGGIINYNNLIDKDWLEYLEEELEFANLKFSAVSVGNPHVVSIKKDQQFLDFSSSGKYIEKYPSFKNGTNFEYAEIVNQNHIKIRVWERGVGETDCCGTGACASVVIAATKGLVKRNEKIEAEFKGGSLWVNWQDDGDIIMTGDFEYIGTGEYDYKNSTAWW